MAGLDPGTARVKVEADVPPIPVAIVVDETDALKAGERQARKEWTIGFVVVMAAIAPILGFVARILYEYARLGWSVF